MSADLIGVAPGVLAEVAKRAAYKNRQYFADTGPFRRELYFKAMQFFAAGAVHQERLFLAANRIGKTDAAAYELRCHVTGLYPKWWVGKRFTGPGRWWVCGDTMQTTRDVPQVALFGPHDGVPAHRWDGMIDQHLVVNTTRKSGGISNCLDTVYIQHAEKTGGARDLSVITFKSYDQGRRTFQGPELEGVWIDEEPPDDANDAGTSTGGIYTECLMRLMTTNGVLMATFTPLRGLTAFLAQYLETAQMASADGSLQQANKVFWPGDVPTPDPPREP